MISALFLLLPPLLHKTSITRYANLMGGEEQGGTILEGTLLLFLSSPTRLTPFVGCANPIGGEEQRGTEGGGAVDSGVFGAHEGWQEVQGGGGAGCQAQRAGAGKQFNKRKIRSVYKSDQTSRIRSSRFGSGWIGSGRVGSGRIGSGRIGSGRIGSGRVGPNRAGSGRVRSGRARVTRPE